MSGNAAWAGVRRALAIRLDNVGDVVMLGPSLRLLRRGLPDAHIMLMATPGGSQVAPMLPWVDDVMVERALWQDISGAWPLDPQRELALVERVRQGAFDAAFIFTSFAQSPYPPAYVCYLAGVPLRVGQSREFGGGLLTHWINPLGDDLHQVDRNLRLVRESGLPLPSEDEGDTWLELAVPADAHVSAARVLTAAGVDPAAPFIAVAPGASAAARRYPPERYAQVIDLLSACAHPLTGRPLPVVLLGSSREAELAALVMAATHGPAVSLVGQSSLVELAALVERCELLIANNSGPMHLADAFRRPVVVLYSGTEYESQWRPRHTPVRLLRRATDCSPCYAFRCPLEGSRHMACLDIEPDEVVAAAMELLDVVSRGSEECVS